MKREGNFRLLLDSAAEGIYEIDTEGNCVFCNHAALNMLGYQDMSEVIGKNMHKLIHHSHKDGTPFLAKDCKIFRAFIEEIENHEDDEVLWTRDGKSFPAEYWSYPIFKEGKPIGSVVTFLDITERKLAEIALRTSEARLKGFIEGTNVGTWDWNVQTGETIFNERWAEIVGYSLAELAPVSIQTWLDLAHPKDLEESGKLLKKVFNRENSFYNCECRMKHRNGEWIWVHDRGKVIEWTPDGLPLRMTGTHSDITVRKQMEMAIQDSEQLFHSIFSKSLAVKLIIDPEDYSIVDANLAAIKFYGYSLEQFKTMKAYDINVVSEAQVKSIFSNIMKGNGYSMNFQHYLADGSIRDVEVLASPIQIEGRPLLYAIVNDITERKQFEEALKESESRLRELNATKDKFFSIIAHDLKTPFNTIIGFSDILLEQIRLKDYEGIEEFATFIQNSSHQAMNLLMNLLEWSRSQIGRMELNPVEMDMVALITGTIDLFQESAMLKSITFSQKLPDQALISADKQMISTVARNLISNAIKFTGMGGLIAVSIKQNKDELIVEISDTGVGIKEADLEKLFRIDETYSTLGTQKEKGTGLGLLLCKELTQKHGGRIWVESEVGKGSIFSFSIPFVLS